MKKIVIAGGHGFIGKALSRFFVKQGKRVVVLSRSNHLDEPGIEYVKWNPHELGAWMEELENAEALINLCGRSVNCRYNKANKEAIYDSRLQTTYLLGEAVGLCRRPPLVWINGMSATIYRHAEDRPMDEVNGELGTGFSVDVCQKWERTFFQADVPHTRKVGLRMAIVLGKEGGVYPVFRRMVRFGMGGKQGNGWQRFSWIHEEDLCRIVDFLIDHREREGVFNAAAPEAIYNHQWMNYLRQELGMPFGLALSKWMLEWGARLIGTETELLLKSRWVTPQRMTEAGFQFRFPRILDALQDFQQSKVPTPNEPKAVHAF